PTTPARFILTLTPKVMARKCRSIVAGGISPIIGPRVRSSRALPAGRRLPNNSPRSEPTTRPVGITRMISPMPRWAAIVGSGSGDDQRIRVGDDPGLSREALTDELGEAEGVLVGHAVPVLERALDPLGDELVDRLDVLLVGIDLLRGDDKAPRGTKARD